MTNKEIAERLRAITDRVEKLLGAGGLVTEIKQITDELDPPIPEPGTVVWWRYTHNRSPGWYLGECEELGVYHFGSDYLVQWAEIEWKPAFIRASDEVVVKVPPIDEWPERIHALCWQWQSQPAENIIITRDEAELMEAER